MNAKYEFIPGDEIVIAPGRTLKRIRALVAIAAFGVATGDAGGYIESEKCLQVYGDAWVDGDARVSGRRDIFWATGVGTEYGTLTVFKAQADGGALVTRGCFIGTPQKFLEKSASAHDERTRREYALLIEVGLSRLGIEGGAI